MFNKLTVPGIRSRIARLGGKAPKSAKKAELIRILEILTRPNRIRNNYLDSPNHFGGVHTLTPAQRRRIRKAENRAKKVS